MRHGGRWSAWWRCIATCLVLVSVAAGLPIGSAAAQDVDTVRRAASNIGVLVDSRHIPPGGQYHPPRRFVGDKDFAGHGPIVLARATVDITTAGNGLIVQVCMNAREEVKDFTEVNGCSSWVLIYQAPVGQCIAFVKTLAGVQLGRPHSQSKSYTDTDHALDVFDDAGVVDTWEITGDTNGDDVGKTGLNIFTAPLLVTNTQCGP